MQILKLTYIAQGEWLGRKGEVLYDDEAEAWDYGPVVPAVYHAYKWHGHKHIPVEEVDNNLAIEEKSVVKFIERILDRYGDKTGSQLSTLTHAPGTPWAEVHAANRGKVRIPKHVLRAYYEKQPKK